jgi:hypothetical protein
VTRCSSASRSVHEMPSIVHLGFCSGAMIGRATLKFY